MAAGGGAGGVKIRGGGAIEPVDEGETAGLGRVFDDEIGGASSVRRRRGA